MSRIRLLATEVPLFAYENVKKTIKSARKVSAYSQIDRNTALI